MSFDWQQLRPNRELTEAHKSLVREIGEFFLTKGMGTPDHQKRVELGKNRNLLTELVQLGLIKNNRNHYYPTFQALYYLPEPLRDNYAEMLHLILKAIRALFESSGPREFPIQEIELQVNERIPTRNLMDVYPHRAALFLQDFTRLVTVRESNNPDTPVSAVVASDSIFDYEDLEQAWREELVVRPSPQHFSMTSMPVEDSKETHRFTSDQLKEDLSDAVIAAPSQTPEDQGEGITGEKQETTEAQDVVPLSRLRDFSISATTRKVFDSAIQLASKRNPSPQLITSSTLLFAMVETGRKQDTLLATRFLQSWISERDQQAYVTAYEGYAAEAGLAYHGSSNLMSANVLGILRRATEIATVTSGSPEIHARHLLGSLLVYSPGPKRTLKARQRLAGMGFNLLSLRKHFLLYLERATKDDHAVWNTILSAKDEVPTPTEPSLAGQLGPSTHVARDRWTTEDSLGHFPYAYAIYRFLTDNGTKPPLAISIQAPWGGGKSSLMRMIQSQLDPKAVEEVEQSSPHDKIALQNAKVKDVLSELERTSKEGKDAKTQPNPELENKKRFAVPPIAGGERRRVTIWFNAWKYDSTSQVWAGLADCIVQQIGDRLGPVERELFWFRLQLRRIDASKIRHKIYEEVSAKFFAKLVPRLFLYFGIAIVSLIGAIAAQANNHPWYGWPGFAGTVCAELFAVWKQFRSAKSEVDEKPARISLGEIVQAPDYSAKLGFVHEVVEDLKRVFEIIPAEHLPMVVFIDDLDRCSPGKVADVVEAINLFLAGEFPQCMFILGIDDEMVAAALDKAHGDVIAKLPGYARSTSIGWRFMDKFVQLPFIVPPSTKAELRTYTESLLSNDSGHSNVDIALRDRAAQVVEQSSNQNPPPEAVVQQVALQQPLTEGQQQTLKKDIEIIQEMSRNISQFSDQEKTIRELILASAVEYSSNPRDVKRFVNLFRFYYFLRAARQGRGEPVPSLEQMCRWIVLSLRWPEVVRWLRRYPSGEQSATKTSLAALETLGASRQDITGWQERADALLGFKAAETPWASDKGLLVFLQKEAALPEPERLSTCAGMGLW